MKRILTILIVISMLFTTDVWALDIINVMPDDSFVTSLGRDTKADLEYIKSIANLYSTRYVVREEKYIDSTAIDELYRNLSAPLTLEQIDSGQTGLDLSQIGKKEYQSNLEKFKILGGLSGYKCEFEPIAFYRIYRDVALVGGYVKYTKTHTDPYEAYWQYICSIEGMTKEIVPYDTRMKLVDEIAKLSEFIDNDKCFKIFLFKSGKIDSMYEWSENIENFN